MAMIFALQYIVIVIIDGKISLNIKKLYAWVKGRDRVSLHILIIPCHTKCTQT